MPEVLHTDQAGIQMDQDRYHHALFLDTALDLMITHRMKSAEDNTNTLKNTCWEAGLSRVASADQLLWEGALGRDELDSQHVWPQFPQRQHPSVPHIRQSLV